MPKACIRFKAQQGKIVAGTFNTRFIHAFVLALLPVLLFACTQNTPPDKGRPPYKIVKIPPSKPKDYVLNLSLATIKLAQETPTPASLAPYLEVIEKYSSQKGAAKSQKITTVIVEYKTAKAEETQKLLVPFNNASKQKFSSLRDVINQLGANAVLYNVKPVHTHVFVPNKMILAKRPLSEIRDTVTGRLQSLIAVSKPFSAMEETRVQMHLAKLFMENRMRDAAYLAIDNAKNSLAQVEKDTPQDRAGNGLASELEQLESDIRKTMPFTL